MSWLHRRLAERAQERLREVREKILRSSKRYRSGEQIYDFCCTVFEIKDNGQTFNPRHGLVLEFQNRTSGLTKNMTQGFINENDGHLWRPLIANYIDGHCVLLVAPGVRKRFVATIITTYSREERSHDMATLFAFAKIVAELGFGGSKFKKALAHSMKKLKRDRGCRTAIKKASRVVGSAFKL
jgi:hypothetical protein